MRIFNKNLGLRWEFMKENKKVRKKVCWKPRYQSRKRKIQEKLEQSGKKEDSRKTRMVKEILKIQEKLDRSRKY